MPKETYKFKDTPDFRRIIEENPGAKFITVRVPKDVLCLIREDWYPKHTFPPDALVRTSYYPNLAECGVFTVALCEVSGQVVDDISDTGYYAAYTSYPPKLPRHLEDRLEKERRRNLPVITVEAHQ